MAFTGLTKRSCGRNLGGIAAVYFTEIGNITDVTISEDTMEITAITFQTGSGKKFKEFAITPDKGSAALAGANSFETTLNIIADRPDAELSKAIKELSEVLICGVFAIVTLNSGRSQLLGYSSILGLKRPLKGFTATGGSGAALTDESTMGLTITNGQPEPPYFLAASLDIDTLIEVPKVV